MKIVVPKETHPAEKRSPLVPAGVQKLIKMGATVAVEAGVGSNAGHSDDEYRTAGAAVSSSRTELLASGDIVLRIRKPPVQEVELLQPGSVHISFLDPFHEKELIERLARRGISAISMEMIPRTTKAQKMDALSSQANLAGYAAVVLAAGMLDKILPMMTTPAGTITPSRVFIIGAGVAGLQAIATAKRLGARVDAFDTRPVVEEQVRSLGAKFVKVDLGETGETKGGYAKALTQEQLDRQRRAMAAVCAQSDIVITTAQVFGRRAPRIINAEMLSGMKPGSVVVDLAVDSGGNVEGSRPDEVTEIHGVRVIGAGNLPSRVPKHASQMYSSNLTSLIEEFWNQERRALELDLEDEILKGCLITHAGSICNQTVTAGNS